MTTYATACAKLGRVEEAKATSEDVLTTQTRVFGREHPYTQETGRYVLLGLRSALNSNIPCVGADFVSMGI